MMVATVRITPAASGFSRNQSHPVRSIPETISPKLLGAGGKTLHGWLWLQRARPVPGSTTAAAGAAK
jgi:hypothetical protein